MAKIPISFYIFITFYLPKGIIVPKIFYEERKKYSIQNYIQFFFLKERRMKPIEMIIFQPLKTACFESMEA
jgi:hypothetical protein